MSKQNVFFLSLSLIVLFTSSLSLAQESITMTTYYPAPKGVYRNLRFYPTTAPACNAANEGVMYYNNADSNLYVCYENPAGSGTFGWAVVAGQGTSTGGNLWSLSGASLYPADTNWNVGVGTVSPNAKLDVNQAAAGIFGIRISRTGGAATANNWYLWNMDGTYGDDFEIWQYPNDGLPGCCLQRFEIKDDGTVTMATNGGNVGINTATPVDRLHVVGGYIGIDSWDSQLRQGYYTGNATPYLNRSIGGAHGWTPSMLYINGWNDWSSGVSIGGPGGTSDLAVTGVIYNGWERIGNSQVVAINATGNVTATCTAGKRVIGGGCAWNVDYNSWVLRYNNYPDTDASWKCTGYNGDGSMGHILSAVAICARIGP